MTNEEFLKHAEKYYNQKSFEHAKKLVAVAEWAQYLLDHVSRDYAEWKEPLEKALKDLERE